MLSRASFPGFNDCDILPPLRPKEKQMLKKLSTGYKITTPGLLVASVCFFLPWVLQSCGTEPMRPYSGLQLAIGKTFEEGAYKGDLLVLLTVVALLVISTFAVRSARGAKLSARDAYGVLGTSVLVLLALFRQFLTKPPEGVNREVLFGLWGYLLGWLLILIGGVVNTLEWRNGNKRGK
jgi:hypothetical protein